MRLRYDAISPITGKQSVLSEFDELHGCKTHLCMESGYHTYDNWLENSEIINAFEEKAPQIVLDSKVVDSNNLCWYKTVMTTGAAAIYPGEDGSWCVGKLIFVDDDEEIPESIITLGIPDETGRMRIKILDGSSNKIFDEFKFEDALFEFHKLCSEIYQTDEN